MWLGYRLFRTTPSWSSTSQWRPARSSTASCSDEPQQLPEPLQLWTRPTSTTTSRRTTACRARRRRRLGLYGGTRPRGHPLARRDSRGFRQVRRHEPDPARHPDSNAADVSDHSAPAGHRGRRRQPEGADGRRLQVRALRRASETSCSCVGCHEPRWTPSASASRTSTWPAATVKTTTDGPSASSTGEVKSSGIGSLQRSRRARPDPRRRRTTSRAARSSSSTDSRIGREATGVEALAVEELTDSFRSGGHDLARLHHRFVATNGLRSARGGALMAMKLNRRTFLAGLGGSVAVSLPVLECMLDDNGNRATAQPGAVRSLRPPLRGPGARRRQLREEQPRRRSIAHRPRAVHRRHRHGRRLRTDLAAGPDSGDAQRLQRRDPNMNIPFNGSDATAALYPPGGAYPRFPRRRLQPAALGHPLDVARVRLQRHHLRPSHRGAERWADDLQVACRACPARFYVSGYSFAGASTSPTKGEGGAVDRGADQPPTPIIRSSRVSCRTATTTPRASISSCARARASSTSCSRSEPNAEQRRPGRQAAPRTALRRAARSRATHRGAPSDRLGRVPDDP